MVWLPRFLLLLVLLIPVTGQDKHYMGGSITFTSGDRNTFRLTVVTGWKLGEGPYGLSCDQQKIGKNTSVTRRQMKKDHCNSYFGIWNVSVEAISFNEYLKGMSSYTSAVNKAGLWEQEVMETDVFLGVPEHDEIRLSGLYWRQFQYNHVENVSSFLQVDLKPWTRNDTGLPNNSPVVMFKPLYRIPLNESTKIILSTMDRDDDFVRCEVSPSTLTAVKTMPNTTISKDCSITVEAYESDGFLDEGYGVVTLVARDFNRHVLAVGGEIRTIGDTRQLSTVHVQFMVETVKGDAGPSFLSPTRESQHVFVVYIGSVLEIPLYATDGSQMKFLARSVPNRQFTVHATQTVRHDRKNMSSTTVTWEPTGQDAGVYLFSASVIDSRGRDALDRNYKIIVKDAARASQTKSSSFYFKETVKDPVQCLQHATCTFFVSIATESDGDPVVNLTESRTSTAQVQIGTPQKMNDSYTSYISITSSTIGTTALCLKAIDINGSQSEDMCLRILINPRDPCEFPPCVHGVCESEKEQFSCICEEGYAGRLCDTEKFGTVNSQKQDDTGSTSVLVPFLGCLAGLTAGGIAIFVIKRFCGPCSKANNVSTDFLESRKQEDEVKVPEPPNAIYGHSTYGPTFGAGHDLYSFNGTVNLSGNYFPLNGHCDGLGTSYTMSGDTADTMMCSTLNCYDIEVYSVQASSDGSVMHREPWRPIHDMKAKTLRSDIETYSPLEGVRVSRANILLVGAVGAGKSSYFNTINSIFRGHVTSQACSGSAEHSLTNHFRKYKVRSSETGQPLKLRMCDTRGLEGDQGLDAAELVAILDGHLPDKYMFNPAMPISPDTPGYKKLPTLEDKIHCVAFVMDGSTVDVFQQKILQHIKAIQQKANQRGIPQVVILTKADKVCASVADDPGALFYSSAVSDLVEQVSELVGLPRAHVLPVKNYEKEMELLEVVDIPALVSLRQMLRFADDFLYNFLDEEED